MIKPFESFLAQKFEEYISYRQGLGYTETHLRLSLSYLDHYLKDKGIPFSMFTPSFFLEFRKTLDVNPKTANGIITVIRGFFWYLERNEESESNPLSEISPLKENHFFPFVFSEGQIEDLLSAIIKRIRKTPRYFLHDLAEYTAISLLARCGMRISEPTKLLLKNYDQREATLYIEKTKFKKDRLIPIPKKTTTEIENYLAVRKTIVKDDHTPYLIIAGKDEPLVRHQLYPVFDRAIKKIGLSQTRKTYGNTTFGRPTPHSFRHSFAINTLKRIKEQGKSPQNALPILAAYLGHLHYRHTAIYLKVTDSQQRLELLKFAQSRDI